MVFFVWLWGFFCFVCFFRRILIENIKSVTFPACLTLSSFYAELHSLLSHTATTKLELYLSNKVELMVYELFLTAPTALSPLMSIQPTCTRASRHS